MSSSCTFFFCLKEKIKFSKQKSRRRVKKQCGFQKKTLIHTHYCWKMGKLFNEIVNHFKDRSQLAGEAISLEPTELICVSYMYIYLYYIYLCPLYNRSLVTTRATSHLTHRWILFWMGSLPNRERLTFKCSYSRVLLTVLEAKTWCIRYAPPKLCSKQRRSCNMHFCIYIYGARSIT